MRVPGFRTGNQKVCRRCIVNQHHILYVSYGDHSTKTLGCPDIHRPSIGSDTTDLPVQRSKQPIFVAFNNFQVIHMVFCSYRSRVPVCTPDFMPYQQETGKETCVSNVTTCHVSCSSDRQED